MQFRHASLILFVVLLGTAVLTAIVFERQRELNEQRAAILEDIGGSIDVPDAAPTPAQQIDPGTLQANQYLSTTTDLNTDGVPDTISLAVTGNSVEGTITTITINGTSAVFPGTNPEGWFGIVDINTADHEKEIAVSDLGPSTDYTTGFYRFDGSSIQLVGTTQGRYEEISFAGNGILTTQTRAKILQTWFYDDQFSLNVNHTLAHVSQHVYPIDPTSPSAHLTMLQDLSLYTDTTKATDAIATTLKKGEAVQFIGCDDVAWCELKSATGILGWFYVEDYSTIVKPDGTRVPAEEVFEGLSAAD